jgi:hypothetical protein
MTGDPLLAEAPGQQLARLRGGEQVQRQRLRGHAGHQVREPVAAGDDDKTPGCTGQQRPDLLDVARVVEHHQHPPAGEQAAVEPHLCLGAGRDLPGRYRQRIQEPADRLGRRHRVPGRVEAP